MANKSTGARLLVRRLKRTLLKVLYSVYLEPLINSDTRGVLHSTTCSNKTCDYLSFSNSSLHTDRYLICWYYNSGYR